MPPHCAPTTPVALATVIDGPNVGAKLLVDPDGAADRFARASRTRPGRDPRCARRTGSGTFRRPQLRPRGTDHARRPRRSTDGADLRRIACPASADVDLRRRRLHRCARPRRQGARLPGHGVRRPRGLRHHTPLPDGRRGEGHVADPGVRGARRRTRPTRRGVHPHPRPEVRCPGRRRSARHPGRLHRRDGEPLDPRSAHRAPASPPVSPTTSSTG